ncbi:MAG: hypothetical protein ACOC2L_01320 [Candidatus Sumerlaeota bacterium]
MKRITSIAVLLSLVAFLLAACGEESTTSEQAPAGKTFNREETIQRINQLKQIDSTISKQIQEMETQLGELKTLQNEMQKSIEQRQVALEKALAELRLQRVGMSEQIVEIDNSLRDAAGMERVSQAAPTKSTQAEEEGWPLIVKILIVIAIVVVLIVLLKKMTQSEEFDDDDLLDEEFLEENDLGTVRYPSDTESSAGTEEENTETDGEEKSSESVEEAEEPDKDDQQTS